MSIDQSFVREHFSYHPDGYLVRKKAIPHSKYQVGDIAGASCKTHSGKIRRRIKISGKWHSSYRLIFLYHHGWTPETVDHIDRDCSNDKIENLRPATQSQQCANKKFKTSTGYKGVHRARGKWRARITVDCRKISLGTFPTRALAAMAYNKAAKEYFGEFALINEVVL